MPSFDKGPSSPTTPFGKNSYLRSTELFVTESFTVAADSVTAEDIDGSSQKILQSGEVMAKITSGPDAGKIGPFDASATDGRQTVGNIVGINDTFLPWQLLHHDEQVAVVVACRAYQARCFERDGAGARIALSNTTADALVAKKTLNVLFA